MKMNLKFDYNFICKTILQEQLGALNLEYKINSLSEVEFKRKPTEKQLQQVTKALKHYGISIIVDQQSALVQRIKELITELINDTEKSSKYNASDYLAEQLNYSYAHLSSVFSETTYSSIENFIILKKIDLAKELIIHKNYTLTEIAHKLNYSSVAHLSAQFKKTTGLTPSAFQRIINKRKENE
ncbi:helix-turn-helix domain-containing protein [Cellulophaga omnivescoria]|uniref:helix-turn-helix domain-containing protein n=1 Tax=Cellulophaga omnivescoria TaxID=1888890 RepID=UPI003EB84B5F